MHDSVFKHTAQWLDMESQFIAVYLLISLIGIVGDDSQTKQDSNNLVTEAGNGVRDSKYLF